MSSKKVAGITKLSAVLIVLVIIFAGLAAWGLTKPPERVVSTTTAFQTKTVTQSVGAETVTVTKTETVGTGAATVTQTVTETVTKTETAPGAAAGVAKLKVLLILPISEEDFSWNHAAYDAITKLKDVYGFELSIERNLFDGTAAEPYAVDYAKRGYNIIVLQGIQYMDMACKIAPDYPKTLFVCVDCFKPCAPNVYNIWMTTEEGGFIMGVIAGKLTKSNKIGLVGGGRVPSIWAGHEAFKAGALYVNPNVEFLEAYMALSWADVAGAKKTAESHYAAGADVVFSSGDGVDVGVIEAAKEKGFWANTVYADLPKLKPELADILMGSIVFDWEVVYSAAIRDYLYGTWEYGFLTATMASGIIKVSIGPKVPEDIKNLALDIQSKIMFGAMKIYFDVNPETGNYVCFETPEAEGCAPTAAKVSFLPPL